MTKTENQVRFAMDRMGKEWTGCAFGSNGVFKMCQANVVGYWKDGRFEAVAPICRFHANREIAFAKTRDNPESNYLVQVSK